MSKSTTLLKLIDYINVKKKFTIQELADEFSVSYKTMWRYLKELDEMGVPLYSEMGVNGGYRILKEYSYPSTIKKKANSKFSCEIVYKDTLKLIGFTFTSPYSAFDEVEILAPRLWIQLKQRIKEIENCINPHIRIGVAHNRKEDFTYYLTMEVEDIKNIPDGMISIIVEPNNYASFTHTGSMERDHVHESYRKAYNWIQANGYEINSDGLNLEIYDEKFNPTSCNNQFTFYLPLK